MDSSENVGFADIRSLIDNVFVSLSSAQIIIITVLDDSRLFFVVLRIHQQNVLCNTH